MEKSVKDVSQQVAIKWVNVPLTITIVLWSGCVLNLKDRWEGILRDQGYDSNVHDWAFLSILLGYLGWYPGMVAYNFGTIASYVMSAVLALIGFIGLGICSSYKDGSSIHLGFTLVLLVIVGYSAGNAVVTATMNTINNFFGRPILLIVVLVVTYIKMGSVLENSARHKIFGDVDFKVYYPVLGVFLAAIYLLGALLNFIFESSGGKNIDDRYKKAMINSDKIGLLIYIVIAIVLGILVYVFDNVLNKQFVIFIILICFIALNFIVLAVIASIANNSLNDLSNASGFYGKEELQNYDLEDTVLDTGFIWLYVATFIVIGTCSTFIYDIRRVRDLTYKSISLDTYTDAIWISDIVTRVTGGCLAYFLKDTVGENVFGGIGALMATIGFILGLIAKLKFVSCLYFASIFIGIGSGMWWVIPPMVILSNAGPNPFGPIWTTVFSFKFYGIISMGLTFYLFFQYADNPLIGVYIVFAILCFIASILSFVALPKKSIRTAY